jgi:tetratricopeptide (TPR) repeat protein
MNKNSFLFGIGGLFIGLIIGFFVANNLNQPANFKNAANIPQQEPINPQVNNVVVKDQQTNGAMMPEIAQTLEKAKNEPDNFEAQTAAGDLYLKIQNFPKALEFYETANKIKPEDYETIVKIGNTNFDSKQYDKAKVWYEMALEKKPDDVGVRTDLGITFVERANPDLDRAIKEFQTSLKTNPKHEPTLYNLGVAYFKKGDLDQAKNIAKQLEQVNPQSELNARFRQILQ